jgi:acyl carrier protein
MSSVTAPELSERILEFIRTQLGVDDALTPDTPLVTNGLIDSVGLMRVAAFLEQTTGITIPDQDINAGHFDTVRQIDAYLRGRAGA